MGIFYTKTGSYDGEIHWGNVVIAIIVFIVVWMAVMPLYNVWSKQLSGKAELREAQWNRQVQVEEAQANLEAEKLNAKAEVERAKGAAQAIEIEDGQLTERYIQYLYVQNLEKLNTELIYVPTEGGIPIMEANRLK